MEFLAKQYQRLLSIRNSVSMFILKFSNYNEYARHRTTIQRTCAENRKDGGRARCVGSARNWDSAGRVPHMVD
ncbi:hypothetical protein GCK32_006413 [Trichostrongylus colubriformis]|uniref:Uncharacterized protein n=1 Tax=Trichostrongylus colubriformis TaxID=6319 RepID=A0AAN8EU09_TRICO